MSLPMRWVRVRQCRPSEPRTSPQVLGQPSVFAFGDIVTCPGPRGAGVAGRGQAPVVAANILALARKLGKGTAIADVPPTALPKHYRPGDGAMIFLSLGRRAGFGQVGGMQFSGMVVSMKSRDMFVTMFNKEKGYSPAGVYPDAPPEPAAAAAGAGAGAGAAAGAGAIAT